MSIRVREPPEKGQELSDRSGGVPSSAALRSDPSAPAGGPVLVPYLYLDSGRVVAPVDDRYALVRDGTGHPVDPFEVADGLVDRYQHLCIVDLNGVRHNRPQLDFLQELCRDGDVWVDAGVRTGDQVIDVLVTGARRAVLSTAYLRSPKELRRAWRLSPEILFAVVVEGSVVSAPESEWDHAAATSVAESARKLGIVDLVVVPRTAPIDWTLFPGLAAQGPVWVGGQYRADDAAQLARSGAAGALFDPGPDGLASFSGTP